MRTSASRYHRHRFPAEIIGHCVWLYFRFALSFRDVEEMLAMRGVALSYETYRRRTSHVQGTHLQCPFSCFQSGRQSPRQR